MNHFKGKQFKKDVIIVAVGYYLRYNLSYREVQDLLYDRGINVCHTTIYRWVQEYSKVLYYLWKKKNRQSFYSWKMDETYIKVSVQPLPRLRAWRPFEEYIKRTEEMERSSAFRCLLKSRY